MVQSVEPAHPFNEYGHDNKRLKGYSGHAYPSVPDLFPHSNKHGPEDSSPLNMHLSVVTPLNESILPDPSGVPHASDLTSPLRSTSQSCRSHATAACHHHMNPPQQYVPAQQGGMMQGGQNVQNQNLNPNLNLNQNLQGNDKKAPTSASETSQTSPLPLQLMPINTNPNSHTNPGAMQFPLDNNLNPQYNNSAPLNSTYGPPIPRDQIQVHGAGGSQGGWGTQTQSLPGGNNRSAVSNNTNNSSMLQPVDRGYNSNPMVQNNRPMSTGGIVNSQGGGMMGNCGGMMGGEPPCAACKSLRRKCTADCLLLPYFPRSEPDKFAHVHKVFGASNVTKILQSLPPHQREDAVSSLEYEARARVEDPVYGCVGIICILQVLSYISDIQGRSQLVASRVIVSKLLLDYEEGKGTGNAAVASEDLGRAFAEFGDLYLLGAYSTHGVLLYPSEQSKGRLPEKLPGDVSHIDTTSARVSVPYIGGSAISMDVTAPIFEKDEYVGILYASMDAQRLLTIISDKTGLQRTGQLLLGFQSNGTVESLFPSFTKPFLHSELHFGSLQQAVHNKTGCTYESGQQGQSVVACYQPVGYDNWGICAQVDVSELYETLNQLRTYMLVITGAVLFVGLASSYFVAKYFSKPILHLHEVATSLAERDFTARATQRLGCCKDEIDDLNGVFNFMAGEVAGAYYNLEQNVADRTHELAVSVEELAAEVEYRKSVEGDLQKAKDAAVAADEAKSQWLANMSHEIRTPLNGIVNCIELCLDTLLNVEQKEYLQLALFSTKHMMRLISDILDFSKIEAGKMNLESVEFSIYEQMENAVSVLASRAKAKGLDIANWFMSPDIPETVIGDPGRLFQVLMNLLGNGIKFTDKGHVIVSAEILKRTDTSVDILFSVKDSGIGIPKDKQGELFKAFSQVFDSSARTFGGTGLGLMISSRLAKAMGGQMWVDSNQGQGSTFFFTVPFLLPNSTPENFSSMNGLAGTRVLVVEDSKASCYATKYALQSWGFSVEEACKSSALAKLVAAKDMLLPFQLLIVDSKISDRELGSGKSNENELSRRDIRIPSTPCSHLLQELQQHQNLFGVASGQRCQHNSRRASSTFSGISMTVDESEAEEPAGSASCMRSDSFPLDHGGIYSSFCSIFGPVNRQKSVTHVPCKASGSSCREATVGLLLSSEKSGSCGVASLLHSTCSCKSLGHTKYSSSSGKDIKMLHELYCDGGSGSSSLSGLTCGSSMNDSLVSSGGTEIAETGLWLANEGSEAGSGSELSKENHFFEAPSAIEEAAEEVETIRLPVIVTVNDIHDQILRHPAAASLAHLLKPIQRSSLLRAIKEALNLQDTAAVPLVDRHGPQGTPQDEFIPAALHTGAQLSGNAQDNGMNVLVVEDNLVNQKVILALLRKWGCKAMIANNGKEALEQTKDQDFDFILMDIQMPVCDGLQATRLIREREKLEHLPRTRIIAMTASAFAEDGHRCMEAGMDEYLSKPLDSKKLRAMVSASSHSTFVPQLTTWTE